MDFLDFIPSSVFDIIGILAGLVACAVVFIQLLKEFRDPKPSTLSLISVVGWLAIFSFWFLYGIRFRAIALWSSNFFAVILQFLLMMVLLRKRKSIGQTS